MIGVDSFSLEELSATLTKPPTWALHFNPDHKTYKLLISLPNCNSQKIDSLQLILLCLLWCSGTHTEKAHILFNLLNP